MKIKIHNLTDLEQLAYKIAKLLSPKFTIAFNGELGAGKTTLIRYILEHMGIKGTIKSPTYTLVEQYQINEININHFDLYRFHDAYEWFDSGFDEYFTRNSICFIEWAVKADDLIPDIDWRINIILDGDVRCIQIVALTVEGQECLRKLTDHAGDL